MIDFRRIKTIPFRERAHLEYLKNFKKIEDPVEELRSWELDELAEEIVIAYRNKKQVIFMMGGHVIKVGVGAYIADLIEKGIITHVAGNGAFAIHDFEIAFKGETSEDVRKHLPDGSFGMVEETGRFLNEAAKEGALRNKGYGYSVAKKISDLNLPFKETSVLYSAFKKQIPITCHSAIGTEIIHQHPSCDGAALGKTTYEDFKILTDSVSKLENGVVVNLGSAVVMPEVFLKSLTIARNLGFRVEKFTAANLDMIEHYRPKVNVLERPTDLGGKKIFVQERHEKTIPSLYQKIKRGLNEG